MGYLRVLLTCYVLAEFLLVSWVNLRQRRRCSLPTLKVPRELEGVISEEDHLTSARYSIAKHDLGAVERFISMSLDLVGLWVLNPLLWRWGCDLVESETIRTLLFLGVKRCIELLFDLPLSYVANFFVEESFGFNKMSRSLWLKDIIKTNLLCCTIAPPVLCLFITVFHWAGDRFVFYLSAVGIVTTLLFMVIYPIFIMPLFNKFEPLQNVDLKSAVEKIAQVEKFPLYRIEQIDGSKRSSHSNAFFYGFWRFKRVVFFDTLLHLPQEQILGIFCHELGHWAMKHTKVLMAIQFMYTCTIFYIVGLVVKTQWLYESLGYKQIDRDAFIIALTIFSSLFPPVELLIMRAMTHLSRVFEYQADRFAVDRGHGEALEKALEAIHKDNRSFCDPDPVYSFWYNSHPTLVERNREIRKSIDKRKKFE